MKTLDLPPSNLGRLRSLTEELTSEETELFLFFKLSPDMFCLADNDGYLQKINDAWTRILGWTQDELLSRPFTDFIHLDDVDKTLQIMSRMHKQDVIRFHNRYKTTDNEYKVLEWSATKWTDGLTYAVARPVPSECMKCPESQKRFGDITRT